MLRALHIALHWVIPCLLVAAASCQAVELRSLHEVLKLSQWELGLSSSSVPTFFEHACKGSPSTCWGQSLSASSTDLRKLAASQLGMVNVTVPCTVLACLVQTGMYPDLYYDQNLRKVPTEQFQQAWWYRTTVTVPRARTYSAQLLRFHGLNYRANVWVNGVLVGSQDTIVGAFRYFEFVLPGDTTEVSIAVQIFPPHDYCFPPDNNSTDLAITFVDWVFAPPDANMGLWRDVELWLLPAAGDMSESAAAVDLHSPMVSTVVHMGNTTVPTTANLTAAVIARNVGNHSVTGALTLHIPASITDPPLPADLLLSIKVSLAPASEEQILWDTAQFPALSLNSPRLWWPWQMGQPVLHNITWLYGVNVVTELVLLDGSARAFTSTPFSFSVSASIGLRQVESSLEWSGGHRSRVFRVNGRRLLVRGGGYSPDLLLREDEAYEEHVWLLMRSAGLNTLRLEGKMPSDAFFSIADRLGMLAMPGWCCCDAWQHWSVWQKEQYVVASESLRTQLLRLRAHPSVFVFLYGSDQSPPAEVEDLFLEVFEETLWTNTSTHLASASNTTSNRTGNTGVKMSGPYAWVPPVYWNDPANALHHLGGAYSFLTEGGPGGSPLNYAQLLQTTPLNETWPVTNNAAWDFHCGSPSGLFGNLRDFTPALAARYGAASNALQFTTRAQVATYEAQRAMFESYSRAKYNATGLIQWMANNAIPQHIWNLVDWYLHGGGSFFGAQKATRPLSASLNPYDYSVWLVNSLYIDTADAPVLCNMSVYNANGNILWAHSVVVDYIAADSTQRIGLVPVSSLHIHNDAVAFIRLSLTSHTNASRSSPPTTPAFINDYWYNPWPDVLEWDKSSFYFTPCSSWTNYAALNELPAVSLNVSVSTSSLKDPIEDGWKHLSLYPMDLTTLLDWLSARAKAVAVWNVTVSNHAPDAPVAFHVQLSVRRLATGADVLPVFWSDNYITLMPGESRIVTATFACPGDNELRRTRTHGRERAPGGRDCQTCDLAHVTPVPSACGGNLGIAFRAYNDSPPQ